MALILKRNLKLLGGFIGNGDPPPPPPVYAPAAVTDAGFVAFVFALCARFFFCCDHAVVRNWIAHVYGSHQIWMVGCIDIDYACYCPSLAKIVWDPQRIDSCRNLVRD